MSRQTICPVGTSLLTNRDDRIAALVRTGTEVIACSVACGPAGISVEPLPVNSSTGPCGLPVDICWWP